MSTPLTPDHITSRENMRRIAMRLDGATADLQRGITPGAGLLTEAARALRWAAADLDYIADRAAEAISADD